MWALLFCISEVLNATAKWNLRVSQSSRLYIPSDSFFFLFYSAVVCGQTNNGHEFETHPVTQHERDRCLCIHAKVISKKFLAGCHFITLWVSFANYLWKFALAENIHFFTLLFLLNVVCNSDNTIYLAPKYLEVFLTCHTYCKEEYFKKVCCLCKYLFSAILSVCFQKMV